MKHVLLTVGLIAAGFSYGQKIIKCATTEAVKYAAQNDPSYLDRYEETFQKAKQLGKNAHLAKSELIIPVVVHIVYNKDEENLPDSVIHNQIKTLNEDYNRYNPDHDNLREDFHPIAGSANIKFVLAGADPDGNPSTGITRTETTHTTFLDMMDFITGGMASLERIKSTADGGIDPWDQNRYLNIWVGNISLNLGGSEMTMLLGYATPPDGLPHWPAGSTTGMSDGVVVSYNVFGSNNPNPMTEQGYVVKGRTATHEVGHYLGLRHIWGDSQNCDEDDGVDDTPKTTDQSESMTCDLTKNKCVDEIVINGDTLDLPDMVENFMDYSAETCQVAFTKGQVDIIRGVLEGPRYDLAHDNDDAVGVKNPMAIMASIYPNPTEDNITMAFSENPERVVIYDLNGKEVQSLTTNSNVLHIDLSNLNAGVYTVKFGKQLNNTQKVVKL